MKLWTLQNEIIYDHFKYDSTYLSNTPNHIPSNMSQWFSKKTKFNNWPIWCWLTPPDLNDDKIEHIKSYPDKSLLLELKIPNNEKMIFINEKKWDSLKRKFIHKNKELNEIPELDEELFNIDSMSKDKTYSISVCIPHLHMKWIEQAYQLKNYQKISH